MELIPISTAQRNQGDCKLFLLEGGIFKIFKLNLKSNFNFIASYPPHLTFTSEPSSSLVLKKCQSLVETDTLRVVCLFPKKKNRSVNLKSSLPDRLLTNNVEHTYM